ncbi:hypothetical protein [Xylanibacillus composti]|uniref:Uncharacterized protein n=1 Tax=Xylanibacillus composti TaxID=1572762 RepID=A0A8J4H2L3_9BACL|nr:hypothetical protein [Xylanibacillus composti]GIQ68277.1 hypothetical protein XYCOK13_11010 [Xylanibacillus composti]
MNVGWIAGAMVAAIGAGGILAIGRALQLRRRLAAESMVRLAYGGSCFGAYRGNNRMKLWSGSGMLALTPSRLRFMRYFGRASLNIPLTTLTGIHETHTFRDKVSLSRLMVVTYREADGTLVSVAFTNVDAGAWSEAIRQQRQLHFM